MDWMSWTLGLVPALAFIVGQWIGVHHGQKMYGDSRHPLDFSSLDFNNGQEILDRAKLDKANKEGDRWMNPVMKDLPEKNRYEEAFEDVIGAPENPDEQ